MTHSATRHKISATQAGHMNGMDGENDYTITFTYEPGAEPVFVSIDPPSDDRDSQADLEDWAKNWLDENADRAMDAAQADLLQEAHIK